MCSSLSHSGKLGCFPFVEGQSHGIALFDTRDLSIVDFHLGAERFIYLFFFSLADFRLLFSFLVDLCNLEGNFCLCDTHVF